GGVGKDDIVVKTDAKVLGPIERCLAGDAAVAGVAWLAGAGDGANFAAGIDDAQRMPRAFEDINVPLAIDARRPWIDQRLCPGVSAVGRRPFLTVARDQRDQA